LKVLEQGACPLEDCRYLTDFNENKSGDRANIVTKTTGAKQQDVVMGTKSAGEIA
jgi:hypothetical protein